VARQIEACRAADPLLAAAELAPSALDKEVDQGLVVAAMERLENCLTGRTADTKLAFSIALQGASREGTVFRAAARLAARGSLSEAERGFLARFLRERTKVWGPESAPELALAFGSEPSLREDLAMALRNLDDFSAAFPAVEAALARAGRARELDALLPAWLSALVAEDRMYQVADVVVDEAVFRRVVRAILDQRDLGMLLSLYRDVHAAEQAAIVLDELGRSPLREGPAMEAALQAIDHWMKDADNAVLAGWLRACTAPRAQLDTPSSS
jgi:hypothetical protein